MKKVKLVSILAMALAALLMFAACGQSASTPAASTPASTAASSGAASTAGEESTAELPLAGVKILQLANTRGDGGLHDDAAEGVSLLETEYGATIKQVELGNTADAVTKYLPTLLDACEEGWDYIICGSSQMLDPVKEAADEFPDQKIIIFDVEVPREDPADYPNVYSCLFKQNEASYLAGAMAMAMSDTGTIGFIGGMEIPVINDFLVGYIDGARAVNPDAKVLSTYVGDWNDLAKAKELAKNQYNQGATAIFPAAGQAFAGVFEAGLEMERLYIGCDRDRSLQYVDTQPEINDFMPTSVIKAPGNAIVHAFGRIIDGENIFGTHETVGLKENSVGIVRNDYYLAIVPADVQKQVDDLEAKIISGEIEVKTMYGMSQDEFNEFKA